MDLWEDMSYENLKSYLYNERIVVILPYRKYRENGFKGYEFLAELKESYANRDDINLHPIVRSISKWDESPVFTAIRGIYNETGYMVSDDDLIPLGTIRDNNFSDSMVILYSVNLEDKKKHSFFKTDDFEVQREKVYEWFTKNDLIEVENTLLNSITTRLWAKISGE